MRKRLRMQSTIYTKCIVSMICICIIFSSLASDLWAFSFVNPETILAIEVEENDSTSQMSFLLIYDEKIDDIENAAFHQKLDQLEKLLAPFTKNITSTDRKGIAEKSLESYDAIIYWGASPVTLPTDFLQSIVMIDSVIWIEHNIEQFISYQTMAQSFDVVDAAGKSEIHGYKKQDNCAELIFQESIFPIETSKSFKIRHVPEEVSITSEVSDLLQSYPFSWEGKQLSYITEVNSEIATHIVFVDAVWKRLKSSSIINNNENDGQAELAFYLDGVNQAIDAEQLLEYFVKFQERGNPFGLRLSWDKLQEEAIEYSNNRELLDLLQKISYYNGFIYDDSDDFNPWRTGSMDSFRYKVLIPYHEQALAMIQHTNYWQHLPYIVAIIPISINMDLNEVTQLIQFLEKQQYSILNLYLIEEYLASNSELQNFIGLNLQTPESFYYRLFRQLTTGLAILVFIVMVSFLIITVSLLIRRSRLYENISE